ncbi:hypothetical protein ABW20_dc0103522 [Dactylellina cionopaga]|nr:hypothetical protein ABW20_dc0103522 [Dactylellina cionopaga]
MSFDGDFTLYPDSPTLPHPFDDIDLNDITKRGISKASSFQQQEYAPSMLMYHPYDARAAAAYPEPFEWERMFDDLSTFPSRARTPSVSSVDTTAAAAPASRRGSVQPQPPLSASTNTTSFSTPFSTPSSISGRSGSYIEPVRSCRRQDSTAYLAHRRLSALLANFSFCRSQESLLQPQQQSSRYSQEIAPSSRRSSRTSLSIAPTTSSTTSSRSVSSLHPNRHSKSGRRNSSMLLSHMGAGHTNYRMDSHSNELQQVVAGIPVSAFIHPKMHIPGGVECGPVEGNGGYEDAYPLRLARLWSFDEPKLPVESCELGGYEWTDAIDAYGSESASPFEMAGAV